MRTVPVNLHCSANQELTINWPALSDHNKVPYRLVEAALMHRPHPQLSGMILEKKLQKSTMVKKSWSFVCRCLCTINLTKSNVY